MIKKKSCTSNPAEERIQKLVDDIQSTWDKNKITELYEYFRPFFLKQKGAIVQHYHIGGKEAEDELYSVFLQLLFFYRKSYRNRASNTPGFEYVKFTHWLKRHIKRAWYFLDRTTRKRIDPRGQSNLPTPPEDEVSINEIKEYAKNHLSERDYDIFVKHFIIGYTKDELLYDTELQKGTLNYVIRNIRNTLQDFIKER